MRRMFQRTQMETCASDSNFMDGIDKGLVAQIDIVRNADGHDTIVEHWATQADKDADLRKTEEQAKAKTPRWPELDDYLRSLASPAKPAKAPEAKAEAAKPETETMPQMLRPQPSPVILFVRGPQNHWGFVKDVDEAGSCTLCTYPINAFDFKDVGAAYEALARMRAYEKRHYNWDNNFFIFEHFGEVRAERKPPETKPGEIAFMHKAAAETNPGTPQEGNG